MSYSDEHFLAFFIGLSSKGTETVEKIENIEESTSKLLTLEEKESKVRKKERKTEKKLLKREEQLEKRQGNRKRASILSRIFGTKASRRALMRGMNKWMIGGLGAGLGIILAAGAWKFRDQIAEDLKPVVEELKTRLGDWIKSEMKKKEEELKTKLTEARDSLFEMVRSSSMDLVGWIANKLGIDLKAGRGFTEAQEKINKTLRESGLDQEGNVIDAAEGEKTKRTKEQEKVWEAAKSKRTQLTALQMERDQAIARHRESSDRNTFTGFYNNPEEAKVEQKINVDYGTRALKLQSGGIVDVPGVGSGDKVPMMVEPGTFVLNREASAVYNQALTSNVSVNQKQINQENSLIKNISNVASNVRNTTNFTDIQKINSVTSSTSNNVSNITNAVTQYSSSPSAKSNSKPVRRQRGGIVSVQRLQTGGAVKKAASVLHEDEALSSLTKGTNDWIRPGGNSVKSKTPWSSVTPQTPLHAYLDSVGQPTIGWGSTYYDKITNGKRPVKMGDTITKAKADQVLESNINSLAKTYASKMTYWGKMSDNQQAGLLALGYNAPNGPIGAYPKLSAAVQSGNMDAVAANIDRGGPSAHRLSIERKLLMSGPSDLTQVTAPKPPPQSGAGSSSKPNSKVQKDEGKYWGQGIVEGVSNFLGFTKRQQGGSIGKPEPTVSSSQSSHIERFEEAQSKYFDLVGNKTSRSVVIVKRKPNVSLPNTQVDNSKGVQTNELNIVEISDKLHRLRNGASY